MNINGCTPDPVGILYQNASGTLNHIAVRNQALPQADAGCQSGLGIYVQTQAGDASTVTVENSSVHNYNKNGITGNDTGTTLTVTGNYVQGNGPAPGVAGQNGIQLAFGAKGRVDTNTVIDNLYTDPTVAAASDILLYDTAENSGITIDTNILGNSQIPIGLESDDSDSPNFGDGVTVSGNKVFGTGTYDAIDVCTNGNSITSNVIFDSAQSGIHLDASCGAYYGNPATGNSNTVSGNTMLESECAGILQDPGTTGNTFGSATFYTVPFENTSSTGSCPFVAGESEGLRTKPVHKPSPVK